MEAKAEPFPGEVVIFVNCCPRVKEDKGPVKVHWKYLLGGLYAFEIEVSVEYCVCDGAAK